jgi:hypothetical protein
MSAEQLLRHPWLTNAPHTRLSQTVQSLHSFRATERLRKTAQGVIAVARMSKAASEVAGRSPRRSDYQRSSQDASRTPAADLTAATRQVQLQLVNGPVDDLVTD